MEKKQFIQAGFNKLAPNYNLFNNIITLGNHHLLKKKLAKKIINNIIPDKNTTILDICCGTGDIAFYLEKYATQDQKIIGLDFSKQMLQIAKKKKSRVEFCLRDILPLPYANNSISAITVGFGLRNLVDLDFGLQEIYRVLKKGGCFGSLDMGKVTFPIAKQCFDFGFFYLLPKIEKILMPQSKMLAYFPESTKNYPDAKTLKIKLKKIGFCSINYQNNFCGACVTHFAKK